MTAIPDRGEQQSIGELLSRVTQNLGLLMRQEIALARTETMEKVKEAGVSAVSIAAGGAVALVGLLVLTASLVMLLVEFGVDEPLAAFLVGAVYAIGGLLLLRGGLEKLRRVDAAPRRTIESLKDDAHMLKEQVR